jgi:MFS family permease
MMFIWGPALGKLYDNYGPRWILLAGSFAHVFGIMMISLSTKYYQIFLAQSIVSASGASAIFYPAMNVVGTWFFKKRAFAFGTVAAGSSLGGVILPIMINHLIREVGFAWAMRIGGFFILFMLTIGNLTVKSRLPPQPKPIEIMEFIRPLQEVPYLLVVIGIFFYTYGIYLPFNFVTLQAQQLGMSAQLAGYLLAILNAASIFGRTIPGWIADHIGRFNVMIITMVLSGTITLAIWLPARGNAPIIVFTILYGFASGAFVSMAPAVVAQISDIRKIGVRTGTMFMVSSMGALFGNPIGGRLITAANGSYVGLQIFCGVVMLVGAAVFSASRVKLAGFNPKVKV